jgi:hypothetical protein
MNNYDYRRFDDIPNGTAFADKFGRIYTKTSVGSATEHSQPVGDIWVFDFDTSREYYEADEDELDDCNMWDAWPYFAVDVPARVS